MIPVFAYLRVSGRGQLDGDGMDRQKDTIERYCKLKGFKVIRWFKDGAVSGEVEASCRPQFAEMLLIAGDATAKIIIVERADRMARTLAVSELACEEARKSGLTIYEAASDTDLTNSDDPTRVMIRQILGVLAEWNKNVMVKRLRDARNRTGRHGGRKPFGRRNDVEIETLCLIMGFRDTSGMSFKAIADKLEEMRRPKPQKHALFWNASSVYFIYTTEVERRQLEERMHAKAADPKGDLHRHLTKDLAV